MPRAAGDDFQRFIELLDLADAFCRQERLLTLERTPEQVDSRPGCSASSCGRPQAPSPALENPGASGEPAQSVS